MNKLLYILSGMLFFYLIYGFINDSNNYAEIKKLTESCSASGGWINKTRVGFTTYNYQCVISDNRKDL